MNAVAIPLVEQTHLRAPSKTPKETIADLLQSVSASRLTLFQGCRLRFFFRHVLRLKKPKSAALHVGAAVHQAIRAWHLARWRRQEDSTFAAMYAVYEDAWNAGQVDEPVAWVDPAEEAQQKQVGWRLLETFFRETTLRASERPEAVEASLEADLSTHGLPRLVGVLDLVQARRIIDFKTSRSSPSPERAALLYGTQATAYALLYRQNTGQTEAGVEIHCLIKLKQPRLEVIALPAIGEREESRLLRIIDAYVDALQREAFIPSPGLQCAACEFTRECAAWS